jgi:addiction module HigA family antidote
MHPGELLKEDLLPATGKSKVEIAGLLGVGRQTLYNVLDGKQSITPNLAVRFGKLFGNSPEMWMNMQAAYDLWHAEREVDTSAIPTLSIEDR